MEKKIAIIGSGVSGLSMARMLNDSAAVTVFEQKENTGGLIHCNRVDGVLYHRVGGHVFNSKNAQVTKWFWEHFDKENEFIQTKRHAKVWFQGSLVGYPIEDHLFQLPHEIAIAVIRDLLSQKAGLQADNFEDFLKHNFGETLYEVYFRPYNQKIWNVDLSNVPLDWLEGKLPMPKLTDILVNNILRKEESEMVHSYFYYPMRGGSQFIIDRLADGLDVRLGFTVSKIVNDANGKVWVNDVGPFDALIYTGDVRMLPKYMELSEAPAGLPSLQSNGTTNLLCHCDANDISWLYIPEAKFKAHRIIYT
jgi:protoporphyrinogen oxidase